MFRSKSKEGQSPLGEKVAGPMKKAGTNLSLMVFEKVSTFVVLLLGFFTVLWGFWLVAPGWDVFGRAKQYELLRMLATEYVWGGVAMILGIILMSAAWSRRPDPIRISSLILFYFWGWVATSYLWSDWRILAWIPATFFSIIHGYAYVNLTLRMKYGDLTDENLPYNNKADII